VTEGVHCCISAEKTTPSFPFGDSSLKEGAYIDDIAFKEEVFLYLFKSPPG
jgi:hypothetical protein